MGIIKTEHLTEEQIQGFLFDKIQVPQAVYMHLDDCLNCRNKMNEYNMLTKAFSPHEKQIFDFDITGLVMDRIKKEQKSRFSLSVIISWILVAIGFCLSVLFFGSQYRSLMSLIFSFDKVYILMIVIIVLPIITFQIVQLCTRYKKNSSLLSSQL